MKLLAYILSLYFVGLTMVPCGDTGSALDLDQNLVAEQIDSGHNHGHSGDQCSPFCQCHCCHVHIVNLDAGSYPVLSQNINSTPSLHLDKGVSNFTFSILQPPKV